MPEVKVKNGMGWEIGFPVSIFTHAHMLHPFNIRMFFTWLVQITEPLMGRDTVPDQNSKVTCKVGD